MNSVFTSREMAAGRQLFLAEWKFVCAVDSQQALPPMHGFEIAFAGRSNVGKSSLINALVNRKSLARTSNTPGRTQELVFFESDDALRLVDMPGYGYAEAPKAKVEAWTELIHTYLAGRANLARVYVLIDARHGLKSSDDVVLKALDQAAVSYQIVLTKADQVKESALAEGIACITQQLARRPAAYPRVLATSARNGDGIAELRAAIARLKTERN